MSPPTARHEQYQSRKSLWSLGGVFCVLLATQLGLQAANSAFTSEFTRTYDEAGHFVTGLMMHDFLAGLDWAAPMAFAENYYFHYPKVAIGHWPPVFYLAQGLWTLVFSPSRVSLMALMTLLSVFLSFSIFLILRRDFGTIRALGAGLLFHLLPLVQANSSVVMTEVLLALLTFWATISYAETLASERARWVVGFTVLAVLAIMTKANGLALALLPPLALLLSRRYRPAKKVFFWFPAVVVPVVCGPWYYLTLDMLQNGILAGSPRWRYTRVAIPTVVGHLVVALGAALFGLAIVGLVTRVLIPWKRGAVDSRWAAMGALLISAILFHWVVPADFDPRHMILALPPLICFAAAGYSFLESQPRFWFSLSQFRKPLLAAVILLSFFLGTFNIPMKEWRGFGNVAEVILREAGLNDSALLVSSDPSGEGAFVSEVARREHRPGHIVLRSSKVLARSRWIGSNYKAFFETPDEMWAYLRDTPIGVIVVDRSVPPSRRTPDQALLRVTLEQTQQHWELLGRFPVIRDGVRHPNALHVYSQKGHQERKLGPIRIDLTEMLGRHIESPAAPEAPSARNP